jgi:hypothetical protein
MTLTFNDLKDRLRSLDEVTLLELLNLTSDDIVDRFEDLIEDKQEQLEKEF